MEQKQFYEHHGKPIPKLSPKMDCNQSWKFRVGFPKYHICNMKGSLEERAEEIGNTLTITYIFAKHDFSMTVSLHGTETAKSEGCINE